MRKKTNKIIVVRSSGLAIASMVLGITGIVVAWFTFGILGLIGLPLGIVALFQIQKSNGTLSGKGMAITGIITSSIPAVFFIVAIVFVIFHLPGFEFRFFQRPEHERLRDIENISSFLSATSLGRF